MPFLCGFGAVTIWAAAPVLIKLSLSGLSLLELFAFRYALSFLITLPILFRLARRMNMRMLVTLFPASALIAVHIVLQAYSLLVLDAGWYAMLFAFAPVITLVIFKFYFSIEAIITYAAMLFGVFLFIDLPSLRMNSAGYFGLLAALGTTLAWVFYTRAVAVVQQNYSDWEISAANNTALLIMSICAIVIFPSEIVIRPFSPVVLLPVVLLSVSVPVGYVLFSAALRSAPVFAISVQNIELSITVMLSAVFLAEMLDALDIIGIGIVSLGLYRISKFGKNLERSVRRG